MQVVLLEDNLNGRFGPLTLLRPDFDLRCGALLLREKLELRRPDWRVHLCPRRALAELVEEEHPGRGVATLESGPTLALSGRVVVDDALLTAVAGVRGEGLLVAGQDVVGARLEEAARERIEAVVATGGGFEDLGIDDRTELRARTVRYPWEIVALAPDEITEDAPLAGPLGEIRGKVLDGAHLIEPDSVATGEGSEIGAGAVLDARDGPIVIGRDAQVMANSVIVGPAAIGDGSVVRAGTVLQRTSVGEVCRVGGEIDSSVFQSHANKQHGGFLGHSFVGSWVNLGAATDNSDLKNNYGSVRVEIDGEVVDTGSPSVGATIGDHSKTAIGTKLNTGAVVGIFCNVLSVGFPPKSLPSFSWGTGEGFVEHDLRKALETAGLVMARRGRKLTPAMMSAIERAFEATRRA